MQGWNRFCENKELKNKKKNEKEKAKTTVAMY